MQKETIYADNAATTKLDIEGTIRISLSESNTPEDAQKIAKAIIKILQ